MIVKVWPAKGFSGSTVTAKHLTVSHKTPKFLAKFKWKCQDSIKCPEWGEYAGTEDSLELTHRSLQPRHLNTLLAPTASTRGHTQASIYLLQPKEVMLELSFKQKGTGFSAVSWCL